MSVKTDIRRKKFDIGKEDLFHIHTFRCKHAEEVTDTAYIERALELGSNGIWFTDHAPFPGDPFGNRMSYETLSEYLDTLSALKEKYYRKIDIHIGLEIEYFPSFDRAGYYEELRSDERIELLLLGQHMAEDTKGGYSFDWDKERLIAMEADALGEAICEGIERGYFDIIAHPDRIYRRRSSWTEDMAMLAEKMITKAQLLEIPLEQNESSKLRKHQYWNEFWELNADRCKIVKGLDAHSLDEMK